MAERMGNKLFETKSNRSGGATGAEVLTSRDGKWLKEFRVALRGGLATDSGAVGVEGVRLVEEGLRSGCKIEALLFSESGEKHRERLAPLISRGEMAFPVLRTTDRLFEGIADTEHPQGVAALVVPRVWTLEDALWQKGEIRNSKNPVPCEPLLVVLAGVQDPGNVGTILRTAAAFGATGVVTAATGQSGTASPFAPKAMRASAGAALHLPVVSGMALGILLTQLKLHGIRTLATFVEESQWPAASGEWRETQNRNSSHPDAQSSRAQDARREPKKARLENRTLAPWEVHWCEASALLVGNEGAGLPEEVVRGADLCVHIPLSRSVESLNAAAATAVLLYEASRQRKNAVTGDSD